MIYCMTDIEFTEPHYLLQSGHVSASNVFSSYLLTSTCLSFANATFSGQFYTFVVIVSHATVPRSVIHAWHSDTYVRFMSHSFTLVRTCRTPMRLLLLLLSSLCASGVVLDLSVCPAVYPVYLLCAIYFPGYAPNSNGVIGVCFSCGWKFVAKLY